MTVNVQLKKIVGKTTGAKEARAQLLSGSGPIIKSLLRDATGERNEENGGYYNVDKQARKIVLDAIIPMLQAAGDTQKIEASTAADVVRLLGEGLLTFIEARELMNMLSTKSDIEDMKLLLEKMEALSGPDQG